MGSSMSDVWTRWDFPKFHQPLFFTASFSVSPFKLYFVVLYPLGNCGYREQNYVKQTSLFIKNFIFRFCSKELSGGCDLYLCTLSETGKSLSFSWKFRKKEQSWSRLSSESLFKKKIHALKGVWSSCLFSLTTQQSTFEFQTRRWLLHFIFQSDHKTLLNTFILLQPNPGSPELWLESSPCFSCCCCSNSPLSHLIPGSSLAHAGKGPVCRFPQRTATSDQLALLCAHCRCPSQPQTKAGAAALGLPLS